MERRDFLKMAFGVAAGAVTFAATAQAAPLPLNHDARAPAAGDAHPAVTTGDEVSRMKPEQVRWHHRHWGWRHRHWHHRHWGWRRRHWRRHHWRHHHWRRW
ncbi:twin-arginine translocation signal domain-containing protein [Bradyrhizobium sp. 2S1]|uniref:twin-arginine translocation signal domain-containing protein n=1 Tax=Bradyrhizobium sp. 2S1 TaxID=1404429 RepID=UPI00140E49EB|nr:twin-arginine translocation signal domain-containing protein [Bradyrhizobium sp. 2S1]MCK7669048.1 twin-arginine translocation signal domain-containing protein [Bradyrhizobium sp. 2S1]